VKRGAVLLLAVALAGCGGYPEPFWGRPGRLGARLAVPPPPRLVIAPPAAALLDTPDAGLFAADLADALADKEVPAVAAAGSRADWRLAISAELEQTARGPQVIPTYTVLNPKGISQGAASGPAVSAQTWEQAAPVALKLVAQRDAPAIASLLDSIRAAAQLSDPNSLVNRPPRVLLTGVSGAPGDGNMSLANNLASQMSALGLVVQDTPEGADYTVSGEVRVTPGPAGQDHVEIRFTVLDVYGKGAGQVSFINDVPHGALDRFWGDVALIVAQQAAGGVRETIVNQTSAKRIGARPAGAPPKAGAS
jgi:hypothetical protein